MSTRSKGVSAIKRFMQFLHLPWLDRALQGFDLLQSSSLKTAMAQLYDESINECRRSAAVRELIKSVRMIERRLLDLDVLRFLYAHDAEVLRDCTQERDALRKRLQQCRVEIAELQALRT
jgi:hypothetical protein